jgi:secreted trypsin-like serine protease
MKSLFIFAVILSVAFAGPLKNFKGKRLFAPMQERIIGGEQATEGEFPYLVSIQIFGSHSCGGSVLNSNHILTASHCLAGMLPILITVVAGAHNQMLDDVEEPSQQRIGALLHFLHPTWDDVTIDGDVAIIRLVNVLDLDNADGRVRALPGIADQDFEFTKGTRAINMGWGYTYNGAILPARFPHKVTIQVWDREHCETTYNPINQFTRSMICAGSHSGQNAGSCSGDSGSPLMCETVEGSGNFVACGVVSWGIQGECGNPVWPTVFGNVAHVAEWIKVTAGIDE